MKPTKKSQISLFIVLAIVVLGAVSLFFIVNQKTGTISAKEHVPKEFKPIPEFVESCLKSVAEQGIRELALHGGFIDPTDYNYLPLRLNYNPTDPTESDILDFSGNKLPYWFYTPGKNSLYMYYSSLMPPLSLMEKQLSRYIELNLPSCLSDFTALKKQGFDINTSQNFKVITSINKEDEDFTLYYNITVSQDNTKRSITKFYAKSDLPLFKLYAIAAKLIIYLSQTNQISNFGRYLLLSRTGFDEKQFPPIYYYDEAYTSKYWFKSVLKQKFQQLLRSYVPILQVLGTKNYDAEFINRIPDNLTLEKRFYIASILTVFDKDEKLTQDVLIDFIYNKFPIYFNVYPSNGEIIKGKKIKPKLPKMLEAILRYSPAYEYQFYYDFAFPLVVSIKDTQYDMPFLIAIEANMRANHVLNETHNGLPVQTLGVELGVSNQTSYSPGYTPTRITRTMFCDDDFQISNNVSLTVVDEKTNQKLQNAIVTYGCGAYDSCEISLTDENGKFNHKLPLCSNGYIEIKKQGYKTEYIKYSTYDNQHTHLGYIYMKPLIQKRVKLKPIFLRYNYKLKNKDSISSSCKAYFNLINTTWFLKQNMNKSKIKDIFSTLNITEDCLNTLSKNIKLSSTNNFKTYAINYSKENITELTKNFKYIIRFNSLSNLVPETNFVMTDNLEFNITLTPGKYAINVMLINENGVKIPKKCKKICTKHCSSWSLYHKEYKYMPETDINLQPALWGGLDFNESIPIYFTDSQIYNNNTLILPILIYPYPTEKSCLDSLNILSEQALLTRKFRTTLNPTFT